MTFSNMTTTSHTIRMPLDKMLRHGLGKGKSFFGTNFYRNRSFDHSVYQFDHHPTNNDHNTADDMQNSVTREICRQFHAGKGKP